MKEQLIKEVYKLIQMTINNPNSINRSIADELYRKYGIDREDLIQDAVVLFIERTHQPIGNLSAYINRFTKHALLDIKKHHTRQKREHEKVSLDQWMEDGNDVADIDNNILLLY